MNKFLLLVIILITSCAKTKTDVLLERQETIKHITEKHGDIIPPIIYSRI